MATTRSTRWQATGTALLALAAPLVQAQSMDALKAALVTTGAKQVVTSFGSLTPPAPCLTPLDTRAGTTMLVMK